MPIRYQRVSPISLFMLAFWLASLSSVEDRKGGPAAKPFLSQQQQAGFLKALHEKDSQYDHAQRMIRRPFSSPGYHTTLTGGFVHPTRDSLEYAVALLDSGEPNRTQRAEDILRRVISLQDQDPNSRTYGIWSWFLEEPLEKMSPPDWNWADFCGTQLLQVALDHIHRLPDDLKHQVKESILHAAYSIKRRNVGPGYTNIAVMGAYVTLVAGELFEVRELKDYGKARLKRFYDHTLQHGSFGEYNSPTYTIVAIEELTRMLQHVRDTESQKLLSELNRLAWYHVARHFHPPTRQWAGPHSRCYSTLLRKGTLAFIQQGTNGKACFMPESEAFESFDAHRVRPECPEDLSRYFTELSSPRVEVEAFVKNPPGEHDIIGTTYLHPDFTLGSVNIGDLWNQRRPLLAYWNTDARGRGHKLAPAEAGGVAACRLRCLHDDYDYASASIFTVQDEGDILGAVVFATDRGDTHISLDRLKNATIKAKDLRIRLQFEGAASDINLPPKVELGQPIQISSGRMNCGFHVTHAVFGDNPIKLETGRAGNTAWIDVILYDGPEKKINFAEIKQAVMIFALTLTPPEAIVPNVTLSDGKKLANVPRSEPRAELVYRNYFLFTVIQDSQGMLITSWHRTARSDMSVSVPLRPSATSAQRNAASAEFAGKNPWQSSH